MIRKALTSNYYRATSRSFVATFEGLSKVSYKRKLSTEAILDEHAHDSHCWKCGNSQECCHLFCEKCGKIQPVGDACCNYFKLLDVPVTFKVDEKSLEQKFKEIQKITHPDKFSTASDMEKNASFVSSSTINQAYQALKCPVERARYLLSLHGIKSLSEDAEESFADPELMMEMFELRESIDDVCDVESGQKLMDQLKKTTQELCEDIEEHFQSDNLSKSTNAAIKLQYIAKAIDELSKRMDAVE